jgi:tRNA threonylcarbamoyladenosine biosynthesis protein TsaB
MLLLVTDTSGKDGCVALARTGGRSDANKVEVIEAVPLAGGTFSAQLVPQIVALLSKQGLNKADLDAFVVVSGPGSFTGLRVGLAAIKALAEILHKPIVPVSLLEVLVMESRGSGKLLAVLDAGRGEVYSAEYQVTHGVAHLLGERMLANDKVPQAAESQIVVTSDKAMAEAASPIGSSAALIAPLGAAQVALVGWRKLQAGETVTPEQLEANYIRRSDAEIFAKSS